LTNHGKIVTNTFITKIIRSISTVMVVPHKLTIGARPSPRCNEETRPF